MSEPASVGSSFQQGDADSCLSPDRGDKEILRRLQAAEALVEAIEAMEPFEMEQVETDSSLPKAVRTSIMSVNFRGDPSLVHDTHGNPNNVQ